MKKDKYLLLDENRNALDSLIQSLVFLAQVEQNLFYLKWFVISFHSAVYAFMLLVLQGKNMELIYEKLPEHWSISKKNKEFNPFDGQLISFPNAYKYLKNSEKMASQPFVGTEKHDQSIRELNNKLRNQLIHFKPIIWGLESWYPARVCQPLLDVLEFCIKDERVRLDKDLALAYLDSINKLLTKHAK